MFHAPADSSLGPTGTQSSESWLLWIHSRGSQPASPQAPVQSPESTLTCVRPGGGWGGLTDSWAPAPRQGTRLQRLCLHRGGAQALSSSFLQMARLPGPPDVTVSVPPLPQARDRERKACRAPENRLLGCEALTPLCTPRRLAPPS